MPIDQLLRRFVVAPGRALFLPRKSPPGILARRTVDVVGKGAIQPAIDLSWLTNPPPIIGKLKGSLIYQLYLFNQVPITDTLAHNPFAMLPLIGMDNWGFEVRNGCNQSVSLLLLGSTYDAPASAGDSGASAQTVAASTVVPYLTNIWAPYLGLRATYTVAPTSGQLTIIGWAQPKLRGVAGPVPQFQDDSRLE